MTTDPNNELDTDQPVTDQPSADQPTADQPKPDDATKPTDQWVTGDEPATGPQRSYLQTLAREAGEDVPEDLTKAQASELIDRLQGKSPRVAES